MPYTRINVREIIEQEKKKSFRFRLFYAVLRMLAWARGKIPAEKRPPMSFKIDLERRLQDPEFAKLYEATSVDIDVDDPDEDLAQLIALLDERAAEIDEEK